MSISLVYYILYSLSEKILIPTIIVDILFIGVLVVYVILSILNVENSREM